MAVAAVSSRRVECGAVAGENEGCRRPGDEERGDAWPLSQHARVDLFVLVHTLSFPEWSPRAETCDAVQESVPLLLSRRGDSQALSKLTDTTLHPRYLSMLKVADKARQDPHSAIRSGALYICRACLRVLRTRASPIPVSLRVARAAAP
jgi:hypothetical protein